MRSGTRRLVVGVSLAVLVILGIAVAIGVRGTDSDHATEDVSDQPAAAVPRAAAGQAAQPAKAPASESPPTGVQWSAERARLIGEAVNARDPERLSEVLVLGDEHDPAVVAEEALPKGARLVIDEATFEEWDDGWAVVMARLEGEVEADVQLWLVERDAAWMVAGSSTPEVRS